MQHESTHLVGTSRGSSDDMRECLRLSASGALDPSLMVTRVGGLNAVPDALLGPPSFTSSQILVYPHVVMDLTAIEDMAARATEDERLAALAQICAANDTIWNAPRRRNARLTRSPLVRGASSSDHHQQGRGGAVRDRPGTLVGGAPGRSHVPGARSWLPDRGAASLGRRCSRSS